MSRLECKVLCYYPKIPSFQIRICPDWNVKVRVVKVHSNWYEIRICPDWNVKATILLYR